MSAIGGVLYFDERNIEPAVLDNLDLGLAYLGPDGSRCLIAEPIAFLFRAFYTTEESRSEAQPFRKGHIIATLDGRVDNRLELSRSLGCRERETSDIDLIVAAYCRWGEDGFARIYGDFAVALWDSETQQLVFARDPFGVRRLFYHIDRDRLIWASDAAALLNCLAVPADLDEVFVALYLGFATDGLRSPFAFISPVKPGHVTVCSRGTVRIRRFWNPQRLRTHALPTRASVADYAERFRELLFSAVRQQMRADRPISAQLSGGLDSSSIVCACDVVTETSDSQLPPIQTLSIVYEKATKSDERHYIASVEHHRGRQGIHVVEDRDPILGRWPDLHFVSFPNRDHCFGGCVPRTIEAMQSIGSRVLLSGLCGDQLLSSFERIPYGAADLFRRWKLLSALLMCYEWSVASRHGLLSLLWQAALRPNLPPWLRRPRVTIPNWIDRDLIARTHLPDRIRGLMEIPEYSGLGSTGIRLGYLMLATRQFASGYAENQLSNACIEMRYPFLYLPLVEFLINLPFSELGSPTDPRRFHRHSLKAILPEIVCMRHNKTGPTAASLIAISREWPKVRALIADASACKRGYVNGALLLEELERWRVGRVKSDLFRFLALEMWLRALEAKKLSTVYSSRRLTLSGNDTDARTENTL